MILLGRRRRAAAAGGLILGHRRSGLLLGGALPAWPVADDATEEEPDGDRPAD